MSTVNFTTSLLSGIAGSSSTADQFVTDLDQLAKDLQSGNLSAAQEDFVTLSQDAQNGTGSPTATSSDSGITTTLLSDIAGSSSSTSTFVNELNQLGTDLQNGDLSSAQQDLLSLDSTALNASSSGSSTGTSSSISTTSSSQTETTELIRAIVEALGTGNASAASTGLSELASVSSSSKGATYLESLSESLGSSSSSSSPSNSVSTLLQSLDSNNSSSSSSILSILA